MGLVWGVSAAFFLLDVLTGVSAAFFTDLTLAGDFGSFFGLLPFVPFLPFFVGDSGASSLADLALDDMFARLRGDEGGAFVGRGVVMVAEVCACGRGGNAVVWAWTLGRAGSVGAGVGGFCGHGFTCATRTFLGARARRVTAAPGVLGCVAHS